LDGFKQAATASGQGNLAHATGFTATTSRAIPGMLMVNGRARSQVGRDKPSKLLSLAWDRVRYRLKGTEGWREENRASSWFDQFGPPLSAAFCDESRDVSARYDTLFGYFLAGFLEFRTAAGERVYYPGYKGMRGHRIEGLEGFARTAPLLASWLASGRARVVPDPRDAGGTIDLVQLIREGLLAGTDPGAATYWGDIVDVDQRSVEAADVALVVWLTRDLIWASLRDDQRDHIAAWLRPIEDRQISPNNWLLFRVLVIEVLRSLGAPASPTASAQAYGQFKRLYRGSGWFDDPPTGVDFYNSWAISYALFWIDQVNPALDRPFIREVLRASAELTLHLISRDGVPMMGRSICYRMAVPCPVLIQSLLEPQVLLPGLARRALDAIWLHFVRRGGLSQGAVTQGYYLADKRFLDRYSGPGSCQWSLRSLVLAFQNPQGSAFWTDRPKPLPVEQGDYRLDLPELGWQVEGRSATGEVLIIIPANNDKQSEKIEEHSMWRRAVEIVFRKPHQPHNTHIKYGQRRYSSKTPFTNPSAKREVG